MPAAFLSFKACFPFDCICEILGGGDLQAQRPKSVEVDDPHLANWRIDYEVAAVVVVVGDGWAYSKPLSLKLFRKFEQ